MPTKIPAYIDAARGLQLSGLDNQRFRKLVRRCQVAFVAVDDLGIPLLDIVLPCITGWPSIFHGLMALASRKPHEVLPSFEHYERAISDLRIANAALIESSVNDVEMLHRTMASALLLTFFSVPHSDSVWQFHLRGLLTMIESRELKILCSTRLGTFVVESAGRADISCFSIGRQDRSTKVWLRWLRQASDTAPRPLISDREVTDGYPHGLVTLCALASEIADETSDYGQVLDLSTEGVAGNNLLAIHLDSHRTRWLHLETAINAWQPQNLTSVVEEEQALAITTSWYTLRRAILLFHWRKRGFFSDMTQPPVDERASLRVMYIIDTLSQVCWLLVLNETKEYKIANTMLWPLTVVGMECCGDQRPLRGQVRSLLQQIRTRFDMQHVVQVLKVLEYLWQGCDEARTPSDMSRTAVSMESCARELGIALAIL